MIYTDVPDYKTLKEIITDGARRGGDKRQFIFKNKAGEVTERSFREVFKDVCEIGTYLYSLGLRDRCKIAIISENSYEWNVAYYLTLVGGNISVPMDCRLTAGEIAAELADCSCDAVIYSEKFAQTAAQLKTFPGVCLKHYICVDDFPALAEKGRSLIEKGASEAEDFINAPVQPEDLACITYTSGTTGKTKGVMLSHKNVTSNVVASCRVVSGGHGIGFLPLNHTFAWICGLFACLVRSEWGYICDSLYSIYKDIQTYKPTNFAAVPMAIEMIYSQIISSAKRSGQYETLMRGINSSRAFMKCGIDNRRTFFKNIHDSLGGQLEFIMCGGAYLNPEIEEFMFDIGIQIITGYGLTECSPCVTCSRRYEYKTGSVGIPLDCCEIKINDPDENGVGEIFVRGDNVMMGYYNDPEATAEVFEGDWFKTGDFGRLDDEGFLFFVGRKKNIIVLSSGKNVSPEEVEGLLSDIEYVKEVLVYAENDRIAAEFFLDTENFPNAADRLHADVKAVNEKIADFKQVSIIKTRETPFPKTTTMKIIRKYDMV